MINKPTGGFQALKETIGCFSAVTAYLTRDFSRLITILRACEAKLRSLKETLGSGQSPQSSQAAAMMLYITALIAEHCNLDQIALTDPSVKAELAKITSVCPILVHRSKLTDLSVVCMSICSIYTWSMCIYQSLKQRRASA